jgi:hypothetical protein
VRESFNDPHDGREPIRDTAGEYMATLVLDDNIIAVVSPIQNPAAERFGFSFWKLTDRNRMLIILKGGFRGHFRKSL